MAALAAGCGDPRATFSCADSSACRDGAELGTCESTGYCSFTDPSCASGARYGAAAGNGYADLCVGTTPPPPGAMASAARSTIALGAPTVATCNRVRATLVVRDMDGNLFPSGGHAVVFAYAGTASGAPVVDHGDGTYATSLVADAAHPAAPVTATLDGELVGDQQPLAIVDEIVPLTGLVVALDAARASGACAPPAGDHWADSAGGLTGTLEAFVDSACPDGMSGWCGIGTTDDPFRLAFDGTDDAVDLGVAAATPQYSLSAWLRPRGTGTVASSGTGGILIAPVVAKGAAETEDVTKDINYMMGLTALHTVGSDFERTPDSQNEPVTGARSLADLTWHHVVVTFDDATEAVYVDGVLDTSVAIAATPSAANLSRLCVGTSCRTDLGQVGHFRGDLARVAIYNRALSVIEIGAICHASAVRFAGASCP